MLMLNKLREKHAKGGKWYGIDIIHEDITDNFAACVWEPMAVKRNALIAACEAACVILRVDETIKDPKAASNPNKLPV